MFRHFGATWSIWGPIWAPTGFWRGPQIDNFRIKSTSNLKKRCPGRGLEQTWFWDRFVMPKWKALRSKNKHFASQDIIFWGGRKVSKIVSKTRASGETVEILKCSKINWIFDELGLANGWSPNQINPTNWSVETIRTIRGFPSRGQGGGRGGGTPPPGLKWLGGSGVQKERRKKERLED